MNEQHRPRTEGTLLEKGVREQISAFKAFAKERVGFLYAMEIESFLLERNPEVTFKLKYSQERYDRLKQVYDEWLDTQGPSTTL